MNRHNGHKKQHNNDPKIKEIVHYSPNGNNEITIEKVYELLTLTIDDLKITKIKLKETIKELGITKTELAEVKLELGRTIENSYVDSLTGCYNQNYFIKYKLENFDINRKNNRIAFVVVDINNLKEINDTYGHRTGDKLISDCADNLRSIFRRGDIIVRIGGDEFMVICDNNDNIENFEGNLRRSVITKIRNKGINNLAIGVAVFDTERDTCVDDTIGRADRLMYVNKQMYKSKHHKS